MKKILLALLLIGSGTALLAQDTTTNGTNNTSPTTNNATNSSSNWNNANSPNNRMNKMNDSTNHMNNMNSTMPMNNNTNNTAPMNNSNSTTMPMNNGNNSTTPMNSSNNTNTMNNGTSRSSNGAYKAYNNTPSSMDVPASVQSSFQREYPNATNAQWHMSNDWWHASYNNNGRLANVYYNMKGQSYSVALPVVETSIPDNVISKAAEMYGGNIYDITRMKGMNGQDVYGVRVIENGQSRMERINEDGSKVTEMSSTESNGNMNGTMNSNMNNSNMNNGSMNNNSNNNMNSNATDNNSMNNNATNRSGTINNGTNNNNRSSMDMNKAMDKTNNSQLKSNNDKKNKPYPPQK